MQSALALRLLKQTAGIVHQAARLGHLVGGRPGLRLMAQGVPNILHLEKAQQNAPIGALHQLCPTHRHIGPAMVAGAALGHPDGDESAALRHRLRLRRPIDARRARTRLLQRQQGHLLLRVSLALPLLLLLVRSNERCSPAADERGHRGNHRRGIRRLHHHPARVVRRQAQRRVQGARRRAAHQQRHPHARRLQGRRHLGHLVQRGRNQARKSHHIRPLALRRRHHILRGHHDPQINHAVAVAGQHHTHDILADVVHIALDRGKHHRAGGRRTGSPVLLHQRREHRHALLHHARALHHLRQEHLAAAEKLAHLLHALHQRSLNDRQRRAKLLQSLARILLHKLADTLHQGMRQALLHRAAAPGIARRLRRRCRGCARPRRLKRRLGLAQLLSIGNQAFRRIRTAVEQHILHQLATVGGDALVIHHQGGVDNADIQPRRPRVVQESTVHGLAHGIDPAEGKRHVGNTTADVAERVAAVNLLRRLEEVQRVVGVLRKARAHRQHIGIEDNVFLGEPRLLRQQAMRPVRDGDAVILGMRLTALVKAHDHDRRAVAANEPRLAQELRLAVLQGDGVDNSLALQALQARLDNLPLGGIHHHGHAGDIRLGRDEVQKAPHGHRAVNHAVVEANIQHPRPFLHLRAGNLQRLLILLLADEFGKLR